MSTTQPQVGTDLQTPTPGAELAEEPDEELSEDDVHHLLQSSRRRGALRYLQGVDDTVRMRDLAEQVAAWEHDTTVRELRSKQRQRVYIPLYQSHLPKLDEAGVIEYDQDRGTVRRTPLADELDPYLDTPVAADDDEDDETVRRWDAYSLGAVGLAATVLAGATLGISALAGVSDRVVAAFAVGLFALVTVGRLAAAGRLRVPER